MNAYTSVHIGSRTYTRPIFFLNYMSMILNENVRDTTGRDAKGQHCLHKMDSVLLNGFFVLVFPLYLFVACVGLN